jgi:hypothetical protein
MPVDDQEEPRKGLSPELLHYISPEGKREREERQLEREERLVRIEMHLEAFGKILDEMRR